MEVTPATLALEPGETSQLVVRARTSQGADVSGATIAWSSSTPALATVSATGLVSAIAPGGPISIVATSNGVSASAAVTVRPATPATIAIQPSTASVVVGRTLSLSASVRDVRGNVLDRVVDWTSADPSRVSVSAAGVITGVAAGGPVVVTARHEPLTSTVAVTVLPVPVARIVVTGTTLEANENATVQYTAQLLDSAGAVLSGRAVEWSTDSSALATVESSGLVRTRAAGAVSVRARAEGVEGSATLTVRGLIHRWTFDENGGPGTVFRDDRRGATASIVRVGTNTASAVAGQVTLTGGPYFTSDYVSLPGGMLRTLDDATIEVWATVHSLKRWSRVFDVGSGTANNLFIAWSQGVASSTDRVEFTTAGVQTRSDNSLAPFTVDVQHHFSLSIDGGGGSGGRTKVQVFLDGVPRGSFETNARLRDLIDNNFWLGRSHYGDETAHASYDEVRIHDRIYSASEVRASFLQGAVRSSPLQGFVILPPAGMRDTVRGIGSRFTVRAAARDAAGRLYPVTAGVRWTSSNPSVASVDSSGVVRSVASGAFEIVGTLAGVTGRWHGDVVRMRRKPIDPYLATPISGAQWVLPVVMIEYLSTSDGVNLDPAHNPDYYTLNPLTLDSTERMVVTQARRRKMMVEEGSRFRAYKDASALPSIGYRVVEHIIVYELQPASERRWTAIPGAPRFNDWHRIFADLQLAPLMQTLRVREIWLAASGGFDLTFPSFDPTIHRAENMRTDFESNMASPTTTDVSNSFRWNDDLPILPHTYTVYGIAYRRSQAETVHLVGHQLEALMGYVNQVRDGNDGIFWRSFVGVTGPDQFSLGRAGWTHMPPNTTTNYDYLNRALVQSDIEDWRPDNLGQKKAVNVDTWGALRLPWPGEQEFGQRIESQWYVFWMQSLPGRGNQIPYGGRWMTNWWSFFADWDAAITSGLGLHAATTAASRGDGTAAAFVDRPGPRLVPHTDDRRRRVPP